MSGPDLGAGFRCSGASLLRDEPIAGTASGVRAFLLVEYTGAWGLNALRDARLPYGLGNHLLLSSHAAGVRVLLIRRPDRSGTDDVRVYAAYADPVAPWLEGEAFTDVHEVLDLDLAGLGRGRSLGMAPAEGPLFCVCTHGKHDACCAERGRPVAAALEAAHPEETWEVSHIGGDRFAANMVVLPHGLYYGRLDPVSSLAVAGTHLAGGLDLDHLRGRSGLRMPAQAAEIGLRRQLEETRNDAVEYLGATSDGDVTTARFDVSGTTYTVRVRTRNGEEERLTCQAKRDNPVPIHELLDVSAYS
ncbi:MAG: sucrase ferredoxin [Nocardioides sp.]